MKKKMSLMGVGGKIAIVLVLYLAISITLDLVFAPLFKMTTTDYSTVLIIGIALVVVGFSLNLGAALPMMKAYKKEGLVTKGLYHLFLNPMYVFMIFLTLPGICLILNSWLVLGSVVPAFIAYKIFVREEHKYLEEKFGDEYRAYKKSVIIKFL